MTTRIVARSADTVTIQIQISLSGSCLLDSEETIQTVLNEAGTLATGEALKQFDTDGEPFKSVLRNGRAKGDNPRPIKRPMEQ